MMKLVALVVLIFGCGSVEVVPDPPDAPAIAADAGADATPILDAPASDTSPENHPDAGAPEVPPSCARGGAAAVEVASCSPSCATCAWPDFAAPAPAGCTLSTGKLCVRDCAACL